MFFLSFFLFNTLTFKPIFHNYLTCSDGTVSVKIVNLILILEMLIAHQTRIYF